MARLLEALKKIEHSRALPAGNPPAECCTAQPPDGQALTGGGQAPICPMAGGGLVPDPCTGHCTGPDGQTAGADRPASPGEATEVCGSRLLDSTTQVEWSGMRAAGAAPSQAQSEPREAQQQADHQRATDKDGAELHTGEAGARSGQAETGTNLRAAIAGSGTCRSEGVGGEATFQLFFSPEFTWTCGAADVTCDALMSCYAPDSQSPLIAHFPDIRAEATERSSVAEAPGTVQSPVAERGWAAGKSAEPAPGNARAGLQQQLSARAIDQQQSPGAQGMTSGGSLPGVLPSASGAGESGALTTCALQGSQQRYHVYPERPQDEPHAQFGRQALSAVPHGDPRQVAFSNLAVQIIADLAGRLPAAIVLSSPLDGTGTTRTVLPLADALARQMGGKILLVDADYRKADLTAWGRVFGHRGLWDAIHAPANWPQFVCRTDLPGVFLLPGAKHSIGADASAVLGFRELLEQLLQHYRLVVVDAPSLMQPGTVLLGSQCEGLYLVARLRHTSARALREAAELLRCQQVRLLGCVVLEA